jgi:uncharacterized protein (DUF305 family)
MAGCGTTATDHSAHTNTANSVSSANSPDHADHSSMQSSPHAEHADYDLQFIDTMIVHHQGAVDMAAKCGEKAAKAEIKKLCADIISSQKKEIEQMRAWRESWFAGKAPAINMQLAGMADSMKDMDMKKLGALNGIDHDLEFIRQMIPHHVGAVAMGKEALTRSSRPEIKTLAEAIIKAQNTEIKQMNAWQTAWSK